MNENNIVEMSKLYAYVQRDEKGQGAVVGMTTDQGHLLPLISPTKDFMIGLKGLVQNISNMTSTELYLVEYSHNLDLDIIKPQPVQRNPELENDQQLN